MATEYYEYVKYYNSGGSLVFENTLNLFGSVDSDDNQWNVGDEDQDGSGFTYDGHYVVGPHVFLVFSSYFPRIALTLFIQQPLI